MKKHTLRAILEKYAETCWWSFQGHGKIDQAEKEILALTEKPEKPGFCYAPMQVKPKAEKEWAYLGCAKCGKLEQVEIDKNYNKKLPNGWVRNVNPEIHDCCCPDCVPKPKPEKEYCIYDWVSDEVRAGNCPICRLPIKPKNPAKKVVDEDGGGRYG